MSPGETTYLLLLFGLACVHRSVLSLFACGQQHGTASSCASEALTCRRLFAVVATQQVSAGLTAPRIFQQKSIKANKALQSFGPLYRSVSRPNNFAYNPALDSSEVTIPFKFVRPDCPPDVAESSVSAKAQQSAGSQNTAKQVKNTARSALEQVKGVKLFLLFDFPSALCL